MANQLTISTGQPKHCVATAQRQFHTQSAIPHRHRVPLELGPDTLPTGTRQLLQPTLTRPSLSRRRIWRRKFTNPATVVLVALVEYFADSI